MEKITKMLAALMFALLAVTMVSCDKEENESKKTAAELAEGEYQTRVASSVPMMNFTTNCGMGSVKVIAKTDSTVDVYLPDFNVKIESEMAGRPVNLAFEIGGMLISDVHVRKSTDVDSWVGVQFSKDNFLSVAGDFKINGLKVAGYVAHGKLHLSVEYRPGNMPAMLSVVSIFENVVK